MLKSMSIYQNDSKEIIKSNFVTSFLAFRGSILIICRLSDHTSHKINKLCYNCFHFD